MHSSPNTAAALRTLSVDILGEILLRQTVADQVDTFIIRPEHDPIQHCDIPQCYLLHPDTQCLSRLYHYPLSLSDVVTRRHQSIAWCQYYLQLDHTLVDKLLALGLDSLGTYALLKSHPPLHCHLNKPLVLLLATHFRAHFESLHIQASDSYRGWLPRLLGKSQKLSRGQARVLARLDYSNARIAIRACRVLLDSFAVLRRFIPDTGSIDGESIILLAQLLHDKPELMTARWLSLQCTSSPRRAAITREAYDDTRRLLQAANVGNIEQTLLRQPHSVADIERLHTRYTARRLEQYRGSTTPLKTRGIEDYQHFTVVRTAGDLYAIAAAMDNCASIYIGESIAGHYVHWLYRNGGEYALLQVQFHHPGRPELTQFYGPKNTPVSKQADDHCQVLLQEIGRATRG